MAASDDDEANSPSGFLSNSPQALSTTDEAAEGDVWGVGEDVQSEEIQAVAGNDAGAREDLSQELDRPSPEEERGAPENYTDEIVESQYSPGYEQEDPATDMPWTAYMDPESGKPYYVNELSGYKTWVQPEDGNFVWGDHSDENNDTIQKHFTTVAVDEENLGPDYESTPWVPPQYEKAEQKRTELLFEQGKAPLCQLTNNRMGKLGVGIRLYFELSAYFIYLLLISAALSTPAYILYSSGSGIPFADIDPLQFAMFTPGMFAPSPFVPLDNTTHFRDQMVSFIGDIKIERWRGTYLVSSLDCIISIMFIASYFLLHRVVKRASIRADLTTTTMSDFTIEVRGKGVPPDTTEEEILNHFSELYSLDRPDFRGRPALLKSAKENLSVETDGTVNSVFDVEHVDGDEMYIGKWVAEVTLIKNDGHALVKYLQLSSMQEKLMKTRAMIKKYSPGTPYSKGPNPASVAKAEAQLMKYEFEQEEGFKSIKESNQVIGAYVVFNHKESYTRCVEDYLLNKNQRFCDCCTWCHIDMSALLFRGYAHLNVRSAPEAGDIQFEFLSFKGKNKRRRCIGRCWIFSILLASFMLIWAVHSIKRAIDKDIPDLSMCRSHHLATAIVGENYTERSISLSRTKKYDDECRKEVMPDAFYVKINELEGYYGDLSMCTKDVHSCIKGGPEKNTLCPCVSAGSSAKCVDSEGESFLAKTVAGCYCIFGIDSSIQGNGFSGATRFLDTDGDLCGKVVTDVIQSNFMKVFGSVIVAAINILIAYFIKKLVRRERHTHLSTESAQVVVLILFGQFMNTSVIIILIYLRFPGTQSSPTPFLFNGEYDDFGVGWYTIVAVFIQTTIFISALSSHAVFLINYLFIKPNRRRKARLDPEHYNTQQELNNAVIPKGFPLEQRVAAQLLLVAVPVVFSPGMPMLLIIGAIGILIGICMDKLDLARHSPHPPPVDATLARSMIEVLPTLIVSRLMFASWVFTNPSIFASVQDDSTEKLQAVLQKNDPVGLSRRLSNPAAVPHVIVLSLLLTYLAIRIFVWPFFEGVYHLIEKLINSFQCGKHKIQLLPRNEPAPPFSEYYCLRLDDDFVKEPPKAQYNPHKRKKEVGGVMHTANPVPKLSRVEQKIGWRTVNNSSFPLHTDKCDNTEAHYKVKAWMSNGKVRGVEHSKGQLKRTWEICQEAHPPSYRMHKHAKYAVIQHLRKEKQALHDVEIGKKSVDVRTDRAKALVGPSKRKYIVETGMQEKFHEFSEVTVDEFRDEELARGTTTDGFYAESEDPNKAYYKKLYADTAYDTETPMDIDVDEDGINDAFQKELTEEQDQINSKPMRLREQIRKADDLKAAGWKKTHDDNGSPFYFQEGTDVSTFDKPEGFLERRELRKLKRTFIHKQEEVKLEATYDVKQWSLENIELSASDEEMERSTTGIMDIQNYADTQ